VPAEARIDSADGQRFVGRAGEELDHALQRFAIGVGHGQFGPGLRADARRCAPVHASPCARASTRASSPISESACP
jgi:hypothetical protein